MMLAVTNKWAMGREHESGLLPIITSIIRALGGGGGPFQPFTVLINITGDLKTPLFCTYPASNAGCQSVMGIMDKHLGRGKVSVLPVATNQILALVFLVYL